MEYIHYVLLDSGYKEGIDLFDIKYVHLYGITQHMQMKHKLWDVLRFVVKRRLVLMINLVWKLNVYKYDHIVKKSGINKKKFGGENSLEIILAQQAKIKNSVRTLYEE
jgi:hypothetical protein